VTGKIEAAAESGIKKVLIPKSNMNDVLIEERYRNKIEIIPVDNMSEVLEHALLGKDKKGLLDRMQKITNMVPNIGLQNPTTH